MRLLIPGAAALMLLSVAGPTAAADDSAKINNGPAQQAPTNPEAKDTLTIPPSPTAVIPPADTSAQGPIGATGQTMPAKSSPTVAAADAVPIMARPIGLNADQRRQIYDSVMAGTAKVERSGALPAGELPDSVTMMEFPADITSAMPQMRALKYVRTDDKVLVVSPPNRIVIDEIGK